MVMEIAAFNPNSADRKLRRPVLMLKDYLLDDLSSCSSSGFKSFPRRPQRGPSTVRFPVNVEFPAKGDIGSARRSSASRPLHRSPKSSHSKAISALQRASLKVINAVKLLSFPSAAKSASSATRRSNSRLSSLSRSLSRKLLGRRFWRKAAAEEPEAGRWRLFREYLAEKDPPPPPSPDKFTTETVSATLTARVSVSSFSGRNGESSSWDGSEFGAVDTVSTFSGNSVSSESDGAASTAKDLFLPPKPEPEEEKAGDVEVSARVGAAVGGIEEEVSPAATPTVACSKDWPNEEKEQLSPVSVLDCPFKDDDDEISSTSDQYSPVHVGGIRKKHGHISHRAKTLSQLEPLNLDQRLALSELKTGPIEPTLKSYPSPTLTEYTEEDEIQVTAEELLSAIKSNNPGVVGPEEENLLSDFFIEKLESGLDNELEALELAEEWVNKGPREPWTGWEVKSGRIAYVRDMDEKCESWRTNNNNMKDERQEVAAELEVEVWRGLMDEILLDL